MTGRAGRYLLKIAHAARVVEFANVNKVPLVIRNLLTFPLCTTAAHDGAVSEVKEPG